MHRSPSVSSANSESQGRDIGRDIDRDNGAIVAR